MSDFETYLKRQKRLVLLECILKETKSLILNDKNFIKTDVIIEREALKALISEIDLTPSPDIKSLEK